MNKERAFSLLETIGFVRTGGSQQEWDASQILAEEIRADGKEPTVEAFPVNGTTITTATLDMIEPYEDSFTVSGYAGSGSTPEEGLEAEFYYFEQDTPVSRVAAKNKIVLINGYLGKKTYEAIVEAGAVGFITFSGDVLDTEENSDLDQRELRNPLRDIKILPGVHMRAAEAMRLVRANPKTVRICVQQEESEWQSHNVIVDIKGTDESDDVVVFTAHYDSVPFSTGVYDNGAGSVILMELYHYFIEHAPKRNLRFIWCGSEERGLLGSHAYVKQHAEALPHILCTVNVDVGGPVLGKEMAFVCANDSVVALVEGLANEIGFCIGVKKDIYSSDCIPFVNQGIPSVNFCRFGVEGTAHIHSRHDTMLFLSADALEATGSFVLAFAICIINAFAFPIKREVPTDIKEKVDRYLGKKKAEATAK